MRAYKAFNRQLRCREFQFAEGEEYEVEGKPILCKHGFHFCKDLVLTLEYYPAEIITNNLYAEVEILGDTEFEKPTCHKGVTNRMKIVRVIPDEEILALVDGDSNSGDRNSGNRNSGNRNSGDRNSGNRNSGYNNSGNGNSGNGNGGNGNSGNGNSGGWNGASHCAGHFNSKNPKSIRVFNKKCPVEIWNSATKPRFIFFEIDAEIGYKKSFQNSWDSAPDEDRILLTKLPNFDAGVFEKISGIDASEYVNKTTGE